MIRRPPRSTQSRSSAASDVYKRQDVRHVVYVCAMVAKAERTRITELVDWTVLTESPKETDLCLRVIGCSIEHDNAIDIVQCEWQFGFPENFCQLALHKSGVGAFQPSPSVMQDLIELSCPRIFIPRPRIVELHKGSMERSQALCIAVSYTHLRAPRD